MTVNVDASMRTRMRSIWKQVQPFSLTYALTKAHIQSPWSNNQWLVIARWTACTFYVWYLPRYANMTVIMLIQFHSLHRIAHNTFSPNIFCNAEMYWKSHMIFFLSDWKKVSLDFSLQTNNRNRYSCEINILSCGSKWRWKFPISSFVWQKK